MTAFNYKLYALQTYLQGFFVPESKKVEDFFG